MADMTKAPLDGTRILALCVEWSYSNHTMKGEEAGYTIKEIWFHKGKWRLWCGNTRTQSTACITPIEWIPIPYELESVRKLVGD